MAYSAFADKAHEPHDALLPDVLDESIDLWRQLISVIESEFDPLAVDWTFSGRKWGWSLRLKHKKRAVLYMTPSDGHFKVGMALGGEAVAATRESDLPKPLLEIIDGAQKYAEGRAVRFDVRTLDDVDGALVIARIKMMN